MGGLKAMTGRTSNTRQFHVRTTSCALGRMVAGRALAPVGLLQPEQVHGAMAAGSAQQRRLHAGGAERQGVYWRWICAPPACKHRCTLSRKGSMQDTSSCFFHWSQGNQT